MTDYELKVPSPLASRLLTDRNAMAEVLETLLNQVLDAQATEQVGAAPYERSAERGRLSQQSKWGPKSKWGQTRVTKAIPLIVSYFFSTGSCIPALAIPFCMANRDSND